VAEKRERSPHGAIISGCKGFGEELSRQAHPAAGRPSKDPATADKKEGKNARKQPGRDGGCDADMVALRIHGLERYSRGDAEVKWGGRWRVSEWSGGKSGIDPHRVRSRFRPKTDF